MNRKFSFFLACVFSTSVIFCNADSYNLDEAIPVRAEFFEVFPNLDVHYDDLDNLDIDLDNDSSEARELDAFERGFKRAIDFSREREFYKNDALLAIALPDEFGQEIECELEEWFGSKHIEEFSYNQVFYRSLFSITGECGGEVNEVYAALDPSVKRMQEAKLEWYKEEAQKRMKDAARKANNIKNNIKREQVTAKLEKTMRDMFYSIQNRKKMADTTLNLESNIRVILGDIVYFHEPLLKDVHFAHKWNVQYDKTCHQLTGK